MNWITNYVRPKINSMLGRREMPENLWIKCPETRRDGLPPGSRGEPVRHPRLRLSHEDRRPRSGCSYFFDDGDYEPLDNPKVRVRIR